MEQDFRGGGCGEFVLILFIIFSPLLLAVLVLICGGN